MIFNRTKIAGGFLFSFLMIASIMLSAQSKVSHVTDRVGATDKEGYFYSLPQTHLKIEVVVEKVEKIAGPLAAYAERYLGVAGVEQSNSVRYEVKDLRLSTFSQPDPSQLYFVQLDKRSKEPQSLVLSFTESGLIMGVNKRVSNKKEVVEEVQMNVQPEGKKDYFNYFAGYNFYRKTDTIVRRISIDTFSIEKYNFNVSLIEKDPESKAKEIAEKLEQLREDRYLLLTGYQEINYGEGMRYMDGELKKMEAAYISLFTGYTKTEYIYKSFTLLPDKDQIAKNIAAFRFSETQGIFDKNDSRGNQVLISYKADLSTQNIQGFLNAAIAEKDSPMTGYFYRVPEYAEFSIILNDENFHNSNFLISQFGTVVQTPSLKTELEFHPNTGSLKQIRLK